MKQRTIFVALGVMLVLSMVLGACATPTPEVITKEVEVIKTVEVEKEVEVVKEVEVNKQLVFSSRLFSPPREQEFFINEVIKPFEAENDVTVNFQILDDDTLLERAEVQQSTGHVTTDIVCAHNGKMPDWMDADYVEDLTDIVGGWNDRHFSAAFESDTNNNISCRSARTFI